MGKSSKNKKDNELKKPSSVKKGKTFVKEASGRSHKIKLALSFPERVYFYGGKVLTGKEPFEVEVGSEMYLEMKYAGRIGKKGVAAFYIVEGK